MSSTNAVGKRAILFGATGAVGKVLLQDLLSASTQYDQVHAFVRRPFKESSAHKDEEKLIEHVIDFDKLVEQQQVSDDGASGNIAQEVKNVKASHVYITLGTTRAQAGSAKAFERIDREYVLAAAKAALNDREEAQKLEQRVLYCSSTGATSNSPFLYPKSKGLTEEGLASFGYPDCIIFRPGFLMNAERPQKRMLEEVYGVFTKHILGRFTDGADIKIADLSKAFLWAGARGSAGLTTAGVGNPPSDKFNRSSSSDGKVTVVSNSEAKRLAKESLSSTS